jgi:hypothetical protein
MGDRVKVEIRHPILLKLFRGMGWLCIAAAFAAAVGLMLYYCRLKPFRDDALLRLTVESGHNSPVAWETLLKRIRRVGWSHDDCFHMAAYGDKENLREIIERLKPGEDIRGCFGRHRDYVLSSVTNQDAGNSAVDWIKWWKQNQHKSQEQWIDEGFAVAG